MACLLTQAISRDCAFIVGGLERLAIANKSEVTACTSSSITMSGSGVFREIEFVPNSASFTNEMTVSNGSKYVMQGISFQVDSTSQATLDSTPQLALGKFVALTKRRGGSSFILGNTGFGLQATVTSLNSGAAEGDFGGLQVTMTNPTTAFALLWSGSTVPGFGTSW